MSNRSRKQRRRTKRTVEKTLTKLERGLQQLMLVRAHHAERVKKLDTKIAAAEGEIEIVKEERNEV